MFARDVTCKQAMTYEGRTRTRSSEYILYMQLHSSHTHEMRYNEDMIMA